MSPAGKPVESSSGGTRPAAVSTRPAGRLTAKPGGQKQLIGTLNEVADAVSSGMSVAEVLDVIIDRAKWITDTDKAVLVLADENSEQLDLATMIVRGQRDRHEQHWWESRITALGGRVSQSGEPEVEHNPEEQAIIVCIPVLVHDRPIGLLAAINTQDRPFTAEQVEFLAILSAFAASAIENARLAEENRYVLLASERDRIAREMHDGPIQSLFSIALGLEVCKKHLDRDPSTVAERLEQLQEHLNSSMTDLRRFIYDLRPMKLTELGLTGAVQYWLAEVTAGRRINGRLVVDPQLPGLTPSEEACLYRVAKEAVSNAARHGRPSRIEVAISPSATGVVMEITDDGDGFDPSAGSSGMGGIGLKSITQRMRREGGGLGVTSVIGKGTVVRAELPLEGDE